VLHTPLGITQNLILPVGVNTTTSALKTSRLISGSDEECECWMHVLNLIIEHAMGIRVRTKNHKVVDEFPEAEIVRNAAKQLAIFIKANREEYKHYNKGAAVNICLPGDTRVTGNISMF
jgi:hypothetical protein